jgi:hypothetical protein
MLLWTYSRYD